MKDGFYVRKEDGLFRLMPGLTLRKVKDVLCSSSRYVVVEDGKEITILSKMPKRVPRRKIKQI
jgi:hypothetical protein